MELLLLLVILVGLAFIAVPRFLETTSRAHEAAVAGAGSGFRNAVKLARSQWVVNGSDLSELDDIAGFNSGNVDVGGSNMAIAGYPTDTNGNNSIEPGAVGDIQCVNIWNAIMHTSFTIQPAGGSGQADYDARAGKNSCLYRYNNEPNMSISYNASSGEVRVDADSSSEKK